MTVPGVYSPEQVQSHVDSVIASDGQDDARVVEVMARAIHEGLGGNGWAYSNYGEDEMLYCKKELLSAARVALGALRALEGE